MPGRLFHPRLTFIDMWQTLCSSHPNVASYESAGKTFEGNDVWLFKVGNPLGGKVLYDGCLHGWEDIGAEVEYLYAKWLLESGDPIAQKILAQNYSLFVPVINYDRDERQNANFQDCQYGTDLNRNFLKNWRQTPCGNYPDCYNGKSAGSEPETKALRAVFQKYAPAYYLNTHYGGGPYLSYYSRASEAEVVARIRELSQPETFPWSISTMGAGNGMAIGDAYDFGASAWLFEIASPTAPLVTAGTPYGHTAHTLADIQNYFFPRILPVCIAFSEASAGPVQVKYAFKQWQDGDKNPTKTIVV